MCIVSSDRLSASGLFLSQIHSRQASRDIYLSYGEDMSRWEVFDWNQRDRYRVSLQGCRC